MACHSSKSDPPPYDDPLRWNKEEAVRLSNMIRTVSIIQPTSWPPTHLVKELNIHVGNIFPGYQIKLKDEAFAIASYILHCNDDLEDFPTSFPMEYGNYFEDLKNSSSKV